MINTWCYTDWIYRPRTREELDTKLGGGVTFRQGSHQFDIIRLIGGGQLRSVRAMTGRWDLNRPTEGSHVVYFEFEDGTAGTAVYNGYDHLHSSELTYGLGEWGEKVSTDHGVHYAVKRKEISVISPEEEKQLKLMRSGYGNIRSKPILQKNERQPFFGLTLVSCERGDIRQSPNGLLVYGEDYIEEILLPEDESGRDNVIREFYDAVIEGKSAVHDGRWGLANLEVCVAVLESAISRKEIYLSHQVAENDF